MKELTERQREVLSFISAFTKSHTYPPTIREIADHFSISVKGAYDHLNALKKKGYLRLSDKRSRTIEVVHTMDRQNETEQLIQIPILGTVAAGKPILAEENWEGTVAIPPSMVRKQGTYFALNVRGDSMIEAGIMDGDLAIIEKRETAHNGEIVVAVVDDAVTLKRFYKESNRIRLQPENAAYSPIYCQDIRLLGRLSCIIRSYT
ncbi:transcriptional repressor LexA [Gracilinema caldarium]|uniref:LexA repressor n=1 Tax=Gracilinema caldarium (strain ATCC 51460 / DSM 7334 / H1) TaxID=744872 RepID=F8EY21_GRAC1|nr:transcriptional repressor LexA [Gracilinema caldarium]AEJ20682.1 SOS-response transcriptional repressor, LexA [Gracilinema caldarium DSM 7334]